MTVSLVKQQAKVKCTCNGMSFICNRWVFTGEHSPACPKSPIYRPWR